MSSFVYNCVMFTSWLNMVRFFPTLQFFPFTLTVQFELYVSGQGLLHYTVINKGPCLKYTLRVHWKLKNMSTGMMTISLAYISKRHTSEHSTKEFGYALWQEVPKLGYAFWICEPVFIISNITNGRPQSFDAWLLGEEAVYQFTSRFISYLFQAFLIIDISVLLWY